MTKAKRRTSLKNDDQSKRKHTYQLTIAMTITTIITPQLATTIVATKKAKTMKTTHNPYINYKNIPISKKDWCKKTSSLNFFK
jgi:hypothetical protein